jgi:hypothetical protein
MLSQTIKRENSRTCLKYPYFTEIFSADVKESVPLYQQFSRVSPFEGTNASNRMFTRSNSHNRKNMSSYDILAHPILNVKPFVISPAVSSPRLINVCGPILESVGRNRHSNMGYLGGT